MENLLKIQLVESASILPVPPQRTGDLVTKSAEQLGDRLSGVMKGKSNIAHLVGKDNLELMEKNHVNHYLYIGSLSSVFAATSLVETVIWVLRTYQKHGFSPDYWYVMLPEAKNILLQYFPDQEIEGVLCIYDWMYNNIDVLLKVSNETLSYYERFGLNQA